MTAAARILFSLLLAAAPALVGAQTVSRENAAAVRKVIEAQIDAFRKDDAERAFSYASSGIRITFGTAESFMAMVRGQYPVVYRPRSVAFLPPIYVSQDSLVQPVRLTDAAGRAWMAAYPMERGEDGVWRTNGCELGRLGQAT